MKKIKEKVVKGWSLARKTFVVACLWGLTWSVVTIAGFRVAFDYDDTLVNSTPAFNKAFNAVTIPFTPQFWTIVNQSYDLEKPKLLANTIAWALRICGFRITILSSRHPDGSDPLKKEWRHLVSSRDFLFSDARQKHLQLSEGNYVLFFGDSDTDISEGKLAHVLTVRIRRGAKSIIKEEYHPGSFNEPVVPFSEY